MAEITIQQTDVAVSVTDTAVNVLPIVSQVVIETATSATLAVVDPINYDNATIGLNIGNNLTVVSGDLTTTQVLDDIDKIAFDTAAGATAGVGELAWNDTDGTLNLGLKGGNVTLQIGQELVQLVKDADNAGITNGAAYYLVGSDGSNVTVRKAQASTEPTSSKTFGIATESSSGGAKAFLTTFGMVRDIDTSALTEGAIVWLSPTVAGGLTTTKPSAPNHAVMLGLCVKSHAVNGMVFVAVNNGLELEELHDVAITSAQNNDLLAYDSATSLWKNVQLSTLGDSRYARLGAANAFTVGGHTITNAFAATIPLYIRGAASQSANLTEWQSSAGSVLSRISSGGSFVSDQQTYIGSGSTSISNSRLNVASGSASVIGAVIRGAASQSANLLELQNSSGSARAYVTSAGDASFGSLGVGFVAPYTSYLAVLNVTTFAANIKGQVIRSVASQTANPSEWQDSAGSLLLGVRPDGKTKHIAANTATTVGASGAASALPANPVGYLQIDVGGTIYKMPYYNN